MSTVDLSRVVNIASVRTNHSGCEWWSTAGRFVCLTHSVAYMRVNGRWEYEEADR